MNMDRKFFLIAVAGGHGTRMGAPVPKQFLSLGGKTILRMTMERFIDACPGIRIITVLPKGQATAWKRICAAENFNYPQTVVQGGFTRFHSVKNALAKVPDGAVVAIHDGVRPLVGEKLVRKMFSSMSETCRALIPVMPSVDTLKVLDRERTANGEVLVEAPEKVDRSRIWTAQTPQVFLSEDIKAAYDRPFDPSFTDDASVASAMKIPLSFIEGERFNIKITSPGDLVLAEAILKLS